MQLKVTYLLEAMKLFGFIHKIYKKLVMGLIDKIAPKINVNPPAPASDQLNLQELEFLLIMLKQSTFKGEMIETIYNLVIKLQSQYTKQLPK
jgi:hypothetical protein